MIPRSKAKFFAQYLYRLVPNQKKKKKRLFGCALSLTIKSKSIKEISTM